jgi:hypothetical protein
MTCEGMGHPIRVMTARSGFRKLDSGMALLGWLEAWTGMAAPGQVRKTTERR